MCGNEYLRDITHDELVLSGESLDEFLRLVTFGLEEDDGTD